MYEHLRRINTGLCQSTGKTFGEVMPYFLIGLDEMCPMSDTHSDLCVFASADKKKQEKLLQDSHCSITVVRTGTMLGTTGPAFFLMKGATRRKNFTNDYLIKYGMKPGSTIVMTENSHMTDDAWLKVSKAIVKGYRLMLLIKDNPNWHIAELLDGFRSHKNVLEAHKLCAEALIISLKEESNSSHVNQGYNQLVAKNDKKNAAETLYNQRRSKKRLMGKSHISQWDLLTTAMDIIRKTTKASWVTSFEHCNLHSLTWQSFDAFCVKIAPHLCAGKTSKDENVNPTSEDKFALLPCFWHGMSPSERKVVMTVFQVNASKYTPSCLRTLSKLIGSWGTRAMAVAG